MELTQIKGLGMKTCEKLDKLGIKDIKSLLTFYPFRYNIIKRSNLKEVKNNEQITIDGIIESIPSIFYFKGKKDKMNFKLNTGFKTFNIVIFNRGFLKNKLTIGTEITVVGKIDKIKSIIVVSDLYFGKIDKERIEPVYHTTFGLSNKQIRKYINSTVNLGYEIDDYIPTFISQKYHLLNKSEAIRHLHNPVDEIKLKQSIKRTKYEELFVYMLKMNYLKQSKKIDHGLKRDISYDKVEQFIDDLPFELTRDQIKSVEEIYKDLTEDMRMNRLLQGDVGSGKTIVAFITMYINYLGGYQSALMAPTEILAQQHYQNSKELFKKYNIDIALLTGKTKTKEKKEIYEKLKNGTIDFIIGTHALFTDDVIYKNLGLVITDEQHRFGVNQRSNLKNKGTTPDILYMSATPIPRTYALTLYGDMDVSSIETRPEGRKPILTKYFEGSSMKPFLKQLKDYLAQGGQCYVICPLIEDNEDLPLKSALTIYEAMSSYFKGHYQTGLLHGSLKDEEKNTVMQDFKNNKIQILVSTTVVEVGVDVPNANMMVIYNAERFGLSSIHQLRGRIGRGNQQGYCFLLSVAQDEPAKERLHYLEEHDDGFEISQYDLKTRGPGELLGDKQSGLPAFMMGDIFKDMNILEETRRYAIKMIHDYYKYGEYENYIEMIKKKIKKGNEYID